MQSFKDKLHNYEADPPGDIWQKINSELNKGDDNAISIKGFRRKSKFIFYGITAAASVIIIFVTSLLFNNPNKIQSSSFFSNQSQSPSSSQIQDSLNLNSRILKDIINATKDKNLLAQNYESSLLKEKKYLTVAGPECQPVKISPKVATLIESADNEYPPKPVWNKKIEKWKQIMLSSTLSPTSTSLLDIVQLSAVND
jgi:hypothetical protein